MNTVIRVRLTYATDFKGSTFLRPFMCAWRADTGCSGYFEPDQAAMMMELIVSEGSRGPV